jgi:signal transduction histidine kinase
VSGRAVPAWRATVLDGAVAALLLLLATRSWLRPDPWEFLVDALLTLPLVARRRYPVPVFAAVALAGLIQWLTFPRIGPHDLAVLVALYTVAAYSARRWSFPALGVGLLGAVMAWQSVRSLRPVTVLGLVPPLAVVVAVWLVGRNLRTRRRYLAGLEERAVRLEREQDALARAAVAEERARIAREMHDVVAHTVAVMVAQAEGAGVAVRTAPDQAERALAVISDAGRDALTELRRMLGVLRDADGAAHAGPQTGPQPGLGDLDGLVAAMRTSGLPVRFVRDGAQDPLDPTLALAVYRIVQESLTNTLKHCGPDTATEVVLRRRPDRIEIEVTDHGQPDGRSDGTQPDGRHDGVQPDGGHGLAGMRERVSMFAGQLSAGPTPTGGWRVHAVLPTGAGR